MTESLIRKSESWMKTTAYPLWRSRGIHSGHGGFHEALRSSDAQPAELPQRAMVQARQIYSFRLAERMGYLPTPDAEAIVRGATDHLIEAFSQSDASIVYSVALDGKALNSGAELYTQAFAIFALAHAYSLCKQDRYRAQAKRILAYLKASRRAPGGGFTEIKEGKVLFQSNPHMHLFEACIAWIGAEREAQTTPDPDWRELADEIVGLLAIKFVDPGIGALCEHFEAGWSPQRVDGKFVFEPGHHFEWAWLVGNYQTLTGRTGFEAMRRKLFDLGEQHGIHPERRVALDEIWSDFRVKKGSARFWPQTERIKCAVQLMTEAVPGSAERDRFARAADEAVAALFGYIEAAPYPGLWRDTLTESGEYIGEPVKSSSLYHIAGALCEYVRLRGRG